MSPTARALVAFAHKQDHKPGSNWDLQEISIANELKDGEVLVQMIASGICHTDLGTTSYPEGSPGIQYPRIAGQ